MIIECAIKGVALLGKDPDDRRRKKRARFGERVAVEDERGERLIEQGHVFIEQDEPERPELEADDTDDDTGVDPA